ncbi:MAG: plasmid pRiA4b ORF-3 family protein [Candidatus Margulisbacteria bacterium]|jgi:hypothetical protein|nr:plasmid pRiA4b ORF-3 family protein [Candidatus Margulisiibacteriota bacterium]
MPAAKFTVPKAEKYTRVFQFKIVLDETDVWRVIQVPDSYTFFDLHVAIQDAMGWIDRHLFLFKYVQDGKKIELHMPGQEPEHSPDYVPEAVIEYATKTALLDYFPRKRSVKYLYDFGDDWLHTIRLEKTLPREKDKKYPICLSGNMACPPEDCGGLPGYAECIAVASGRKKNNELQEWLLGWKPRYFDLSLIRFDSPSRRFEERHRYRG